MNHQFLRIHEKDANAAKPGDVPYEATVYVGFEPSRRRYDKSTFAIVQQPCSNERKAYRPNP